jgi:hypothetical protein
MAGGIANKTTALCSTAEAKCLDAIALIHKVAQNGIATADSSIAATDTAITAARAALAALQ